MKFGLSQRYRVCGGKSRDKQSDEGLHILSNLGFRRAELIVVLARFASSCVSLELGGDSICFMNFTNPFLRSRASRLTS